MVDVIFVSALAFHFLSESSLIKLSKKKKEIVVVLNLDFEVVNRSVVFENNEVLGLGERIVNERPCFVIYP